MLWHGLHPLKAKDYAVGDATKATNKAATIKLLAWSYTQKTSNNDVFYSPKCVVPIGLPTTHTTPPLPK